MCGESGGPNPGPPVLGCPYCRSWKGDSDVLTDKDMSLSEDLTGSDINMFAGLVGNNNICNPSFEQDILRSNIWYLQDEQFDDLAPAQPEVHKPFTAGDVSTVIGGLESESGCCHRGWMDEPLETLLVDQTLLGASI